MPLDPAQTELADGRQVSPTLDGIKLNHRNRYWYAITKLREYVEGPCNIIDAACGVGYGSFIMGQAGYHVQGFDVSRDAILFAQKNYISPMTKFMRLDLGAEDLTLPQAEAVVSLETIEHVKDAPRLLSNFAKCAPLLIATVPNEDGVPFDPIAHPHHWRHYTKAQFEKLLNDAGYDVLHWAHQRDKFRTGGQLYDGPGGICLMVTARQRS